MDKDDTEEPGLIPLPLPLPLPTSQNRVSIQHQPPPTRSINNNNNSPIPNSPAVSSILETLKPPPAYAVQVSNLTLLAPPPKITIPLAIPIPLPSFLHPKSARDRLPTELVRSVNIRVEPGELLAIAGGSGSGKTTLLNALAGRLGDLKVLDNGGKLEFLPLPSTVATPSHARRKSSVASPVGSPNTGSFASPSAAQWWSPKSPGQATTTSLGFEHRKGISKVVGFVRQDDFLLPYLTVRETLSFAAALRLPRSVNPETREAIVDQTILELGLRDVANVIVGGPFRKGISGGEKRRLSIGCILVTLPSVLVLDEPTTGLDSTTAFHLLETLSRLARKGGRVVILSIHQPRSDAFTLFDKVTLLTSGSVVYSGRTSGILSHFADHGYVPADNTNPLDFVVDITSIDTRDDDSELATRERVGKLVLAWRTHELELATGQSRFTQHRNSVISTVMSRDAEENSRPGGMVDLARVTSTKSVGAAGEEQDLHEPSSDARASLVSQTGLLTRRSFINISRNYGQSVGFFLQFFTIGVVMGAAFFKPPQTPAGVQTLKTITYQSTPACFYLSIIVSCWIQCSELVVFDREREDNLYSTVPYVVGSWLSYLPGNVLFPTMYAIIIYFMCGFRRDDLAVNLLSFIAQCILQQLAAWGYALITAAINRSFAQASLLANGFSIPFILTAGYLIIDLPVWIRWARWISPYFYGYQWITRLQFINRSFSCEGVTGAARNACEGNNVLVGLRFHLSTPLYVYPLGLVGFVIVTQAISVLILHSYHPGGVKHAAQRAPSEDEKAVAAVEKATAGGHNVPLDATEQVDVNVENLQLFVGKKGGEGKAERKCILAEVGALFPGGQVSVIMGPSGAGKSSLLQLLAGRLSTGRRSYFESTGAILLNGQPLDASSKGLIAFVEQEDAHHLPALTVRETLRYAARLRLRGRTTAECNARAEEVLRMLGLKPCADNLVGGELLKGISGGEKRRLSLGVQLISDPSVLLADEPLSGLDAFTALGVMQTLKDIANSGRTVIVSVHQPRSDIWRLFDNVLLLAKGGRSVYSGSRANILKTFEAVGLQCPQDFNPADFLLDAISVDVRSTDAEAISAERVGRLLEHYRTTTLAQKREQKDGQETPVLETPLDDAPFLTAFPVVLGRSFKNLRRQQDVFVARLLNPPFMSLMFWLFFARLKKGPSGAQDRVGLLQETTALPFVGMLACVSVFPAERNLFFHERKSSARHSVTTFLLSYTVQEACVSIISSGLLSVVFVYGMNLQGAPDKFFQFWWSMFCLISYGESVGIVFSTFFENGGLAVSLISVGFTLLSQLNGIISVTLPHWLAVIGWVGPGKPQSYLNIINEMSGLVFNCTDDEVQSGLCIYKTGDQLLQTFGILNQSPGKLVGILAGLIVLFRLSALLALRIKTASL
ncbi:P-loop containing nucleoside triphosphate hydrolase protein [Meredithblackwellia eburnea MCA 4105]